MELKLHYSSPSEKRQPGSQTMLTCTDTSIQTADNVNFKCVNRDILARHEAVLLKCLIVVTGTEMYCVFGNKQHVPMHFSTSNIRM